MGTSPAMASIPSVGDIRNAPVIHNTALRCIFLSSFKLVTVGAPLKNHNWKPYNAIGKIHVLYSSLFCSGRIPLEELPSSLMALSIDMLLVA